jgi:hypothetical protein
MPYTCLACVPVCGVAVVFCAAICVAQPELCYECVVGELEGVGELAAYCTWCARNCIVGEPAF